MTSHPTSLGSATSAIRIPISLARLATKKLSIKKMPTPQASEPESQTRPPAMPAASLAAGKYHAGSQSCADTSHTHGLRSAIPGYCRGIAEIDAVGSTERVNPIRIGVFACAAKRAKNLLYATDAQPNVSGSKQTICLTSDPLADFQRRTKRIRIAGGPVSLRCWSSTARPIGAS
jgi:hypothetical protein